MPNLQPLDLASVDAELAGDEALDPDGECSVCKPLLLATHGAGRYGRDYSILTGQSTFQGLDVVVVDRLHSHSPGYALTAGAPTQDRHLESLIDQLLDDIFA